MTRDDGVPMVVRLERDGVVVEVTATSVTPSRDLLGAVAVLMRDLYDRADRRGER